MIILGAGNLGQALANYVDFEKRGFKLVGIFDVNPVLEGIAVRGIEIQMLSDLPLFLKENEVEIAILTLPKNKAKEMAMLLQIPKSQRAELQEVLDALVADGKADVSKKGKYSKAKHHFVTGVFESHPKGFGFLRMEEGEDIYIPESEVHGAMHLDTVQVKIMPSTGGKRVQS